MQIRYLQRTIFGARWNTASGSKALVTAVNRYRDLQEITIRQAYGASISLAQERAAPRHRSLKAS